MRSIGLINLLLIFCFWCHSQPYVPAYNIDFEKGLTNNAVTEIIQDSLGYMWFGTNNGINRYDGYEITQYYNDSTQHSIHSNNISKLYVDRTGRLWVGTNSGLSYYDYITESFVRMDTVEYLKNTRITAIVEDDTGNLYIGSTHMLVRLNKKWGTWTSITKEMNKSHELSQIRGLVFDKNQRLYVTTNARGFYRIDFKSNNIESIIHDGFANTCYYNYIQYDIEVLNDDEILISYHSFALAKLNINTLIISSVKGPLQANKDYRWNVVYNIHRGKSNRIWISSIHFGLCEYIPEADSVRSYQAYIHNPYGFNFGSVYTVYEDNQNNLWVGSFNKGVYRINLDCPSMFYPEQGYKPNALHSEQINIILPLNSKEILLGHLTGFSIMNTEKHTFFNVSGQYKLQSNIPLQRVICATQAEDGIVWMGTSGLGMMSWDRRKNRFVNYTLGNNNLFDPPYSLFTEKMVQVESDLQARLDLGRFNLFNTKTSFTKNHKNTSAPIFHQTSIIHLIKYREHSVILATQQGNLYRYFYLSDSLIDLGNKLIHTYPSVSVTKVEQMDDEWVYATNLGLMISDTSRVLQKINLEHNNFQSPGINGFLIDSHYIWLANIAGIGRFNRSTAKLEYFGEKEGIIGSQLMPQSIAKGYNGKIYIGSINGLYEIDPSKLKVEDQPLRPQLLEFYVSNKPYSTSIPISKLKHVKINFKQPLVFKVAAFDYKQPANLQFEYKLEGLDEEWKRLNMDRWGTYSFLPPGKYVLQLRCRSINGIWHYGDQKLSIDILPPFWRTIPFMLGCITFSILAFRWYFKQKIRNIEAEARIKTSYEIKLHELENSALRTQMNPHFIFNCLNTINAFVQKDDRANAGLMISRFSRLIRRILNHSRQKRISLKDELETLELYIQIEQIRFEFKFDYSIQIDKEIYTDGVEVPSLIIQPFVENSILHGLLPLHCRGKLNIHIAKSDDKMTCIVQDNGIGIEASKKLRASNTDKKSHGLDITLKRIELFNQESSITDSVQILNLSDESGQAIGTRVEIPLAYCQAF